MKPGVAVEAFRDSVLEAATWLRERVGELTNWDSIKLPLRCKA